MRPTDRIRALALIESAALLGILSALLTYTENVKWMKQLPIESV